MTEIHERLIARFAHVLASLHDVQPVAARLCEAGRQMLDADGAALTVMTAADSAMVVAATDDLATQLEDLQEVVGDGPTRDAVRENAVQLADFTDEGDGRWSMMHEHGRHLGFAGHIVAVPLRPGDVTIGALAAHRGGSEGSFDPVTAEFLGAALGAALIRAIDRSLLGDAESGPWASQAQIHQATGMIVSQVGVRPEDALALLRGQAFAKDTTLLDVAQQIVDRRINFRNFTIEGD